GYGALAAAAARLPVPKEPRLRPITDLRIVGKGMKRRDGPRIVTGAATFGLDVRGPGMVDAAIERAPVFGGQPVRVDAAAAREVAGVRDVLVLAGGVAVVADSTWAALSGRRALAVDWDLGAGRTFDSREHERRLDAAAAEPGVVMRAEG